MENTTTQTRNVKPGYMTYGRCKELWTQYMSDCTFPEGIIDNGTPIANAELIKYAKCEVSKFDEMDKALGARKKMKKR